jgi:hypothetical protein
MTDKAISPLRQRMIEDMTIRKLSPKTQLFSLRSPLTEPPSVIDVACWHFSDMAAAADDVRSWGESRSRISSAALPFLT